MLYKGGSASTLWALNSVVLSGTTPQVDSETEQSCRRTRCFLIRAPARVSEWLAHGFCRAGRGASFTLVEVVIAVGLVAFVLTAILGLVAIAVNETKNADLKARLAWITEQVTSEFQSQRFSTVLASVQTNGPVTSFWDYSGISTNAAGAYFQCDVTRAVPASSNFALLQVSIRWPYSPSSTNFSSTNVSLISVFNYQ